jgi:putative ATP-binding cassette transporter
MDESTSALDAPTAVALYALVCARLPDTTVISIAHNPEIASFHDRTATLVPDTAGSRVTIA